MELIPLFITLIVLGVIAWLVWFLVEQIPMPQPFRLAVLAVGILILILILLRMLPYSLLR